MRAIVFALVVFLLGCIDSGPFYYVYDKANNHYVSGPFDSRDQAEEAAAIMQGSYSSAGKPRFVPGKYKIVEVSHKL